jgi:AcrR family transcriptional regulator
MSDRSKAKVERAPRERRTPLSRDRVLEGAVAVADAAGISGLTIRSLADELGVKPMTVYYYVANKEEILDGIVDIVFSEMSLPCVGADWRVEIAERARSARQVLLRHPWATPLVESRKAPGPATLRHHDAVLGTFRTAGFSLAATAHAYAFLDAFVYGHALQETSLPFEGPDSVQEVAEPVQQLMAAGEYPYMTEMVSDYYLRPGYDFADEFELGLSLVLDALAGLLDA